MAQRSWYYHNDSGYDYHLSIYHGDVSRHVLIYSQSIVIKIDFTVTVDKSYSFMLGEELFNLSIKWQNQRPNYFLHHHDTGRLITTESEKRNYPTQDIIKALFFIFALANVAFLITYIFRK